MKVGQQVLTTSITVLEQRSGPQFIFGEGEDEAAKGSKHRCAQWRSRQNMVAAPPS
jgi:hypothetical protein